jgi:hypothetical protein
MQFCPTLYNRIAGTGVYFLLQLIIVFVSINIAYLNFFASYSVIGWIIAGCITFVFYKWIKLSTKIHHKMQNIVLLVVQFIISLVFALFLSIPICISLFESEITFQLFSYTGKLSYGLLEQLELQPYGLYLICNNENGRIVISFCAAIFLFLLFILFIPYLFILLSRKSLYNNIFKIYEQKFRK